MCIPLQTEQKWCAVHVSRLIWSKSEKAKQCLKTFEDKLVYDNLVDSRIIQF